MHTANMRIPQVATDYNLNLSMNYLFDYILEMGNLQSEAVKMPYDELLRRGVTWMIYRLKLKINRLPKAKEEIIGKTWVSTLEKIRTKREVNFYDKNGELLVASTIEFLVVDVNKNRAVRIPDFIVESFPLENNENFKKFPKFKRDLINEPGKKINIYKSDIDYNKHVNSGVYFRWITDSIEKNNSELKEVDIYYKSQVFYDSDVEMRVKESEDGSYDHQIISDGEIAVIGKTLWS